MRKKNLLTGAVSVFLLISLTACGAGTVVKTGSAASQSMGEEESEMKKESTSEMMNPKTPATVSYTHLCRRGDYIGEFLLGLTFSFGWTRCV